MRIANVLMVGVSGLMLISGLVPSACAQKVPGAAGGATRVRASVDSDRDGLVNGKDSCAVVVYEAGFSYGDCGPMDLNPDNDAEPECKARERVARVLMNRSVFVTNMAFCVVKDGEVYFADAFEYIGGGRFVHLTEGVDRLYKIGSTSKSVTAVAAKVLEERGVLSFDDYVDDDDGTQKLVGGQRQLRDLLRHQGAFKLDNGSIHLYCYDGDLAAFWAEEDDAVSPHFDRPPYGNLGGGYEYSAFNYSLAGAYLANRAGVSFAEVLQGEVFDDAGMCTATLDGARAVKTEIGFDWGLSEAAVMHVGPYINFTAPLDERCEDNFYSSEDLPGDPYEWQYYHLDEADAEARDPAGGVMGSVIDLGHFASNLLDSYHGRPGGILSAEGVRDLWGATQDLGCFPNCPYERYYATGFFTENMFGEPVTQVGHGGSRPGMASAFVLRPESDLAVVVLANADVSTVTLSDLAKAILDDFEG